jgi:TrpR family transcriptional regulator, trp operon repressor
MKRSTKILEYKKELLDLFSKIPQNKEFMALFLKDMFTPNEIETLALRWQIVKKLNKGATHREVAGELRLGISTVTRGSRALRNKNGGFSQILKKLG